MKAKNHLIIAIICFATFAFELIVFDSIKHHPYMVALNLFLVCVGGYQLGVATIKLLKMLLKINNNEVPKKTV